MKKTDETIDTLGLSTLRLIQPKKGYRFSMDPVLLCGFSGFQDEQVIYDLGCGNGVIPLLAAERAQAGKIVGIERQEQMVERAGRSVALNELEARVSILQGDVRNIRQLCPEGEADLVLSNPPFRLPQKGRVSPDNERAAARHELAGGLSDFVRAADYLLKPEGRLCMVFLAERKEELLASIRECRLLPRRLRMVHHRADEEASLILIEAVRVNDSDIIVEAPLCVFRGAGDEYSEEFLAMYVTGTGDDSAEESL